MSLLDHSLIDNIPDYSSVIPSTENIHDNNTPDDVDKDMMDIEKKELSKSLKYKVIFKNFFCSIIGSFVDINVKEDSILIDINHYKQLINHMSKVHIFIYNTFESDITTCHPIAYILDKAKPNTPINIYINSRGGDISVMSYLISALDNTQARTKTICSSLAASAGALLWSHGKELIAKDTAIIMFHTIQLGLYGHAKFVQKYSDVINQISEKELGYVLQRGLITEDEYKAMLDGKDIYFTGKTLMERLNQNTNGGN